MKYFSITLSFVKLPTETTQEFDFRKQALEQIKRLVKNKGTMSSLLPLLLAACGGGGASPAPTSPQSPTGGGGGTTVTPDFTENPTNTFTASDDNNRTLSEGSSTSNLIVIGKGGNDTITTGSGVDIIFAGTGADTVYAGGGDDIIVLIGTTDVDQYTSSSITNPANSGIDLSSLLTLSSLNNHTTSDVIAGESIDGGTGSNSIIIYGTVDLSDISINNVSQLFVNSDVIVAASQLGQGAITIVKGDGDSVIRIISTDGTPQSISLQDLQLYGIHQLDLGPNVTLVVNSGNELQVNIIDYLSGSGTLQMIRGDGSYYFPIIIEDTINIVDQFGTTDSTLINATIVHEGQYNQETGGVIIHADSTTGPDINGSAFNDEIYVSTAQETITARDGDDLIIGTWQELNGDTLQLFDNNDSIIIENISSVDATTLSNEHFIFENGALSFSAVGISLLNNPDLSNFSIYFNNYSSSASFSGTLDSSGSLKLNVDFPFILSGNVSTNIEAGKRINLGLISAYDPDGVYGYTDFRIEILTVPTHGYLSDGFVFLEVGDIITSSYRLNSFQYTLNELFEGDPGIITYKVYLKNNPSAYEIRTITLNVVITDENVTGNENDNYILTGYGNDILYGGDGNDSLYAQFGDDILWGGVGDDYLNAGGGNDELYGGEGDDNLRGEGGDDYIEAGNGNDLIEDRLGSNEIHGGDGDDTIYTSNSEGNNLIYGDNGSDFIVGGSASDNIYGGLDDDIIYGGLGSDYISGGGGNDRIYGSHDGSYFTRPISSDIDVIDGGNGDDQISLGGNAGIVHGGAGNDTIEGAAGDDELSGDEGDDAILGGYGNDILSGGEGNDIISASDGNDIISGGNGNDKIFAGLGDDTIESGDGIDLVFAGAGDDLINDSSAGDWINAGYGNDIVYLNSLSVDHVQGGKGHDILFIKISTTIIDLDAFYTDGVIEEFEEIQIDLASAVLIGSTSVDALAGESLITYLSGSGKVYLSNEAWVNTGIQTTVDAVTYNEYTLGDKTVWIETNLEIITGGTNEASGPIRPENPLIANEITGNDEIQLPLIGYLEPNITYNDFFGFVFPSGNTDSVLAMHNTSNITYEIINDPYFSAALGWHGYLENHGEIRVTSNTSRSLTGISGPQIFINEGLVSVTTTASNGYAAGIRNVSAQVLNYGEIHAQGASEAYGIYAGPMIYNAGLISASAYNYAAGIHSGISLINEGDIIATTEYDTIYGSQYSPHINQTIGWQHSFGVRNVSLLNNSGTITGFFAAHNMGHINNSGTLNGYVQMSILYDNLDHYSIENSGVINGDIIYEGDFDNSGYTPQYAPVHSLHNTGEINGNVWGTWLSEIMVNDGGAITGSVYAGLGNDSFTNISAGQVSGIVDLDWGDDSFFGGDMADTAFGDLGNDTLKGEAGDDLLMGGSGDDELHGGAGADGLYGGTGNDLIFQEGADKIDGGAQDDIISLSDTDFYSISGGDGIDTLRLNGDISIDLTSLLNAIAISSIEYFELLDNSTILFRSGDASNLSTSDTIIVTGTDMARAIISGAGWQELENRTIDDKNYRVFRDVNNKEVLVSLDVTIIVNIAEIAVPTHSGQSSAAPNIISDEYNQSVAVLDLGFHRDFSNIYIPEYTEVAINGGSLIGYSKVPNLINDGTITIDYGLLVHARDIYGTSGISVGGHGIGNLINNGTINIHSGGIGFSRGSVIDILENNGTISVTGNIGLNQYASITLQNSGTIEISNTEDTQSYVKIGRFAHQSDTIGFSSYYGQNIDNSGIITVRGQGVTIAFGVDDAGITLNNSGTITAENISDSDDLAYALAFGGRGGGTINNSGTITADVAIYHYMTGESSNAGVISFDNSGDINGDIVLFDTIDTITNTGTIIGDITLDIEDDAFIGTSGFFEGILDGGEGNDTLIAGNGNAIIIGGEGNDNLTGGFGADIFVFDGTFGNDTITDFEDTIDLLDFSASGLVFADFTITQSGADTLIEDGSGNSIILKSITSTDITADDFIF